MPINKKETSEEVSLAPQNIPNITDSVKFNAETLISRAIDKNLPVETMEKLLSMRRELKAEWSKEQFDKAMAQFQSECPTIEKTKPVKTSSGQIAYQYAPIESIVQQVKIPLQSNGFSYSTSMELLETGVKVKVKVTHKDGHSEITPMEVPLGNKTNVMSQSQVVAAATTFAKRYAFCNDLGILTGDEDTDAQETQEPKTYGFKTNYPEKKVYNKFYTYKTQINSCHSTEELENIGEFIKFDKELTEPQKKELRIDFKAKKDSFELPIVDISKIEITNEDIPE